MPRRLGDLYRSHGLLPIAAAAGISLLIGSAGAAIGLHGLAGGAAGTAGTPGTPPARSDAAMAYDPTDHVTLLFGGQRDGHALSDTWAWDGASWRQLHPATSPSGRFGARMAWDADRGRMVMFGGETIAAGPVPMLGALCAPQVPCKPIWGGQLTDTWTWDGSTWRQEHPAHHPASGLAQGLVDDPGSHQVILVSQGPAVLAPGDGSAPKVTQPPAAGCGAKCTVTCTIWSSTSANGSVSGGGCAGTGQVGAGSVTSVSATVTTGTAAPAGVVSAASGAASVTTATAGAAPQTQPPTPPEQVLPQPPVTPRASPAPPVRVLPVQPVPPVYPCNASNSPATVCGGGALGTFGWNGSDWHSLAPLPVAAGSDNHVVTDPRSGRPLAVAVHVQPACPTGAAAGATQSRPDYPCLECPLPPKPPCALAIENGAAGQASAPPSGGGAVAGSTPPNTAPTQPVPCPKAPACVVKLTYSLTEWRFDGAWHQLNVPGPFPQPLSAGDLTLEALSTDGAGSGVVAIFGSSMTTQTWRFDGVRWSLVGTIGAPRLTGAAVAGDPHGLVLFGGQAPGSAQPSAATYTWDGHSWSRR